MRTRTVEYVNGKTTYRVVVTEATALVGMKRTILQGQAQGYLDSVRTEDGDGKGKGKGKAADDRPVRSALEVSALGVLAIWTYPALMAAASELDGGDLGPTMGMEAFIALPDALVDDWVEATYELNPHWLPQLGLEDKDEAEAEKKAQSDDASVSAPA